MRPLDGTRVPMRERRAPRRQGEMDR
jgi:hypothetical protein